MTDQRDLTDLEQTLLGLLALAPMSGYDVKKAFASSPLARYSPSSGGLYPALRRLERLGLLTARIERSGEIRARRVFTPTAAGLAELDSWLQQPVDRGLVAQRMEYAMMRFALMETRASREQVVAFLEALREAVRLHLAELESYAATAKPAASLHQRLSIEHGVAVYRARLSWADSALREVRLASPAVGARHPQHPE